MRRWEHWRTTINARDLHAVLDAQGLQGWELVQLDDMRRGFRTDGEFMAVFKREVEGPDTPAVVKALEQIARMDPTWDAKAPVEVARKALGLSLQTR